MQTFLNAAPHAAVLTADNFLLPSTDTANNVRYVNAAFVRASGFALE